ncbi:MAG: histidine--tRNA ligase [Candidatus Acidiferrales bacterium]
MSERKQFRAIKGTRDILPPDSARWNWFEHTAREVFESYNFGEIRLPIFEETRLFARAVGLDTDIVGKEMFILEQNYENKTGSDLGHLRESIKFAAISLDGDQSFEEFKKSLDRFSADYKTALNLGLVYQYEFAHVGLGYLDDGISLLGDILRSPRDTGWKEIFRGAAAQTLDYLYKILLEATSALRPEATASVCRAYIEHNMQALPGNQKLYYIGPMFRRERPQKGRYRQFYQIGAEVLGHSDAPAIDAEVLEMLLVFFNRVGLTRTTLYVNSIGDKNCRPQYVELLREELRKVKDKLKEDSQRRIETNPLRVLDSKIPEEQPIIETLPRISDHLCDECRAHFAKLKEELNLRGIEYKENWRLVRGLDYYTRTTFEVTAEGLGSQNAVCGGGRYDGLVELLGGPPTKGIGFAIGTDRSILSIEEGGKAPKLGGLAVYIAWMGQESYPTAVGIARKLRAAGLSVELPPEEMKFKKSLGLADKLGARYALIIGEDEVASRTFTLKRLADSDQRKLAEGELLEYLESERRR